MHLDEEFENLYNIINRSEDGKELLNLTGIGREQLDVGHLSHAYFQEHWDETSTDPNANANNMGPINYGLEIAKPQLKLIGLYLLHRYARKDFSIEYADRLLKNLVKGDYYFHDASGVGIQQAYCYAYSTQWVMNNGIPWGQLKSLPPKTASSYIGQVVETTMEMSMEYAGAIAPADVLVHYAYYSKKEGLSHKEIENHLQSLVHIFNKQFRPGGQSPFTNISIFDRPNLKALFSHIYYEDGSSPDYDEIMRVQRIFLNWFCKGDPSTGLPYRFPIVTTNFALGSDKKILDNSFLSEISQYNTGLGCLNIHSGTHGKLAMCCRFINDPARMRQFKTDTFGNGGLNIGSHRVIALGLPRIAYEAKGNWKKYMEILGRRMEEVRDLLIIHRERILGKRIEQNFLKSFQYNLAHPSHFFSTFGFVGLYEAISAMGLDVSSEEGFNRAKEITMFMDLLAAEYSEEYEYAFNTEEIPAEGAAVTLCRKDKILYPDEVKVDIYSNQFFPLHLDIPLLERISKTGKLMEGVSGGSILHINIDEKIENPEIMETLMRQIIKEGVNHFGINYGFSICPKDSGHNSAGIHKECPICGETIEDWMTRVVGYFVPVSKWNPTRRETDFKSRKWYDWSLRIDLI